MEPKLFRSCDILKGRMHDMVHALSTKNWKRRTLRYASFDVMFYSKSDYLRNKYYTSIAKDTISLSLSIGEMDDLLMILRESCRLQRLRIPLSLLCKIHEVYPIQHLFNHFKLQQLILEKVQMDQSTMNTFESLVDNLQDIHVVLKCISFHPKIYRRISSLIKATFFIEEINDIEDFPFEGVIEKKIVLNCPLQQQLSTNKYFTTIKNMYLPFIISEVPIDTPHFRSLSLCGLTMIGHKTKRHISLPTSLKQLKIQNFCGIDSITNQIGTFGVRTFTSITLLDMDGVEGVINPPHSLHELYISNGEVGKINTTDFMALSVIKYHNVKVNEFVIGMKLDQLSLISCVGIKPIDYKNETFSLEEKH
ncbi:Leucine-rich repeat containing protein [Entamoeba marina]